MFCLGPFLPSVVPSVRLISPTHYFLFLGLLVLPCIMCHWQLSTYSPSQWIRPRVSLWCFKIDNQNRTHCPSFKIIFICVYLITSIMRYIIIYLSSLILLKIWGFFSIYYHKLWGEQPYMNLCDFKHYVI